MFSINSGNVAFSQTLEGPYYSDLYAQIFTGVSNSIWVGGVMKAVFAYLLLYAIFKVAVGDKKAAIVSVALYFLMGVIFTIPWVGDNYLYPALTQALDSMVVDVCQFGLHGFKPADLTDDSAIPEIYSGSLNQALKDEGLQSSLKYFTDKCYGQAKNLYMADPNNNGKGTPKPTDPGLAPYYLGGGLDLNTAMMSQMTTGGGCAAMYTDIRTRVASGYQGAVTSTLTAYENSKASTSVNLNSYAAGLNEKLNTQMATDQFKDSLMDAAVNSVSRPSAAAYQSQVQTSEDKRALITQLSQGVGDAGVAVLLTLARAKLYTICIGAKWFFDHHLIDIVSVIKLCCAAAFPFVFLYCLVTFNPDGIIKLLGMYLSADVLYIVAGISQMMFYKVAGFQNGGGLASTLGGLIGMDTNMAHAYVIAGFCYLFSFTLAGLFTWNTLMSGTPLIGPFAQGPLGSRVRDMNMFKT